MTVHLLFAPTRVASMLAKLEIKQCAVRPSQPGVKFSVGAPCKNTVYEPDELLFCLNNRLLICLVGVLKIKQLE